LLTLALIYPEAPKVGRGQKVYTEKGLGTQTFAPSVSQARTVIEYAPELVDNVKSGIIALDNAYRQPFWPIWSHHWPSDGKMH
jgi:hypothetical protein